MLKRISFLVRDNPTDPKSYFAEGLGRALKALGCDYQILTSQEGQMHREDARALEAFQPDLTCSFSCVRPLPSGQFLWDITGIPHYHYNLDPVLYTLHLFQSPLIQVSCVDRSDVDLLHQVGVSQAFFLPHACDANWTFEPEAERPFDVTLIGSCYDHDGLRRHWQKELPVHLHPLLDEAVDRVLGDASTHFVDAVGHSLEAHSLAAKEVPFQQICKYVDYYCRGRDRWELVQGVSGMNLHIFGEVHEETDYGTGGWRGYVANHPNVKLHGPIPYGDSLKVMAQSKFVLNTSPSFKQGSHERVFAALALGAVPVTGQNLFWQEDFQDEESLLFYYPKRWEELEERLETLLVQETERQEIAAQGRAVVMEKHTWDQRAETLLGAINPR